MVTTTIVLAGSCLLATLVVVAGQMPEPTAHAGPQWTTTKVGLGLILVVMALAFSALLALLGSS